MEIVDVCKRCMCSSQTLDDVAISVLESTVRKTLAEGTKPFLRQLQSMPLTEETRALRNRAEATKATYEQWLMWVDSRREAKQRRVREIN